MKNKITEKTVKTLRDSKDVNEVKQAIAEAKNHGVYNTELETLAKAKLKAFSFTLQNKNFLARDAEVYKISLISKL